MKSLQTLFSLEAITTRFIYNTDQVSFKKEDLGGGAKWAEKQVKNNTGSFLDKLNDDILTKNEVIAILDTAQAKQNWNKDKSKNTPENSALYVVALQAGLKMLDPQKYDPGKIDAMWGNDTKAAVKAFQTDEKLEVDGAPGPITIGRMLEKLKLNAKPKLVDGVNGAKLTLTQKTLQDKGIAFMKGLGAATITKLGLTQNTTAGGSIKEGGLKFIYELQVKLGFANPNGIFRPLTKATWESQKNTLLQEEQEKPKTLQELNTELETTKEEQEKLKNEREMLLLQEEILSDFEAIENVDYESSTWINFPRKGGIQVDIDKDQTDWKDDTLNDYNFLTSNPEYVTTDENGNLLASLDIEQIKELLKDNKALLKAGTASSKKQKEINKVNSKLFKLNQKEKTLNEEIENLENNGDKAEETSNVEETTITRESVNKELETLATKHGIPSIYLWPTQEFDFKDIEKNIPSIDSALSQAIKKRPDVQEAFQSINMLCDFYPHLSLEQGPDILFFDYRKNAGEIADDIIKLLIDNNLIPATYTPEKTPKETETGEVVEINRENVREKLSNIAKKHGIKKIGLWNGVKYDLEDVNTHVTTIDEAIKKTIQKRPDAKEALKSIGIFCSEQTAWHLKTTEGIASTAAGNTVIEIDYNEGDKEISNDIIDALISHGDIPEKYTPPSTEKYKAKVVAANTLKNGLPDHKVLSENKKISLDYEGETITVNKVINIDNEYFIAMKEEDGNALYKLIANGGKWEMDVPEKYYVDAEGVLREMSK